MTLRFLLNEIAQEPDLFSLREKSLSAYPTQPGPALHYSSKDAGKDDIIPLKTWRHHGLSSFFSFAYRTNSCKYSDSSAYRHRDFASRVEILRLHDAHLSSRKGKLRQLVVQCTDDVYESQGMATWCRTYVRKPSPYFVRLAIWTLDPTHDSKRWMSWCVQFLRSFPAGLAMMVVVGSSTYLIPWYFRADWCEVPWGTRALFSQNE